jgi:hypothetical protein
MSLSKKSWPKTGFPYSSGYKVMIMMMVIIMFMIIIVAIIIKIITVLKLQFLRH